MFQYRAALSPEFARHGQRLQIGRDMPGDSFERLMPNGEWAEHPAAIYVESGIFLPAGAWEAVCDLAHPSHGDAEVRRLEEALAVERVRVDNVLSQLAAGR